MDLTEEQWKVLEIVALRGEIIGSLPLEGLAGSPRTSRGVARRDLRITQASFLGWIGDPPPPM